MNTSPTIGAIAKALATAQSEIENVTKDAKNTFFKTADGKASTYATLAAVLDEVRPILAKNEIAVIQMPGNDGELVTVTTTFMHASGEFISSVVAVRPMKGDAQALGASVTYLRRFALAAMCGVAQEDDDGNTASGAQNRAQSHDTQRGQPATAPTTQTRHVAQPAKSADPVTQGKTDAKRWIALMGLEEEYADTLKVLDALHPDDFRPVYVKLKDLFNAYTAKGN